jgi:hypothetical protein
MAADEVTPEAKYRRLEERALARLARPLEAPGRVALDRAAVVVRVWQYPAFDPYKSWCLIRGVAAQAERWLVRRTTWERSADYERASDPLRQAAFMVDPAPAPSIDVHDAVVGTDFAAAFIERLGTLTLPALVASQGLGIDGVENGIEMERGRVRLEWWCEGPPAWRALTEGVERLRVDLDGTIVEVTHGRQ